ncbi:MAG: type II 3-dehydroquinate dehydratase [Gammaproteobacteria bacterium]|tara:strand:- start:342 stop:776 length:435 start_codon:yes stop_codon:yes gene_type:complete
MKNFLLLNGPNLNLLGNREKDIYGESSLEEIEKNLINVANQNKVNLFTFQSNAEHELVDRIQAGKKEKVACILFNPGAFTHTSVALRDAILAVDIPLIEIHISNIFNRESFREKSFFSDIAVGIISGFGEKGYKAALDLALEKF